MPFTIGCDVDLVLLTRQGNPQLMYSPAESLSDDDLLRTPEKDASVMRFYANDIGALPAGTIQ